MDLLSVGQRIQIRNALQDVFDTFHKTPVTLHKAEYYGSDDCEDAGKAYTNYTFNAAIIYGQDATDELTQTAHVGFTPKTVTLEIGLDNLTAVNLVDSENLPKFVPDNDSFTVNGETFIVTSAVVDGAFEQKNVLVIVAGRITPKQT